LHQHFPDAQIDFLLRKGNESLLEGHPYLNEVLILDKKKRSLYNLWDIVRLVREKKYDKVINVQRFASSGIITAFSGAKEKIGFDKNPFSFLFTKKVKHIISDGSVAKHEAERNNDLIKDFTDISIVKPVLYPSPADDMSLKDYKTTSYITVSPTSVWFTKQYPMEKWVDFLNKVPSSYVVYMLGAPEDADLAGKIVSCSSHKKIINLCGKLSFLKSAALMKNAVMNYVNDSAPMHIASAMNAPVTAIYCSTLPHFGFGPLSDKSYVVETEEKLSCRPCGLHGKKSCPLKHFNCAYTIKDEQLLQTLQTNS
jgi:heptosyltransferase-2